MRKKESYKKKERGEKLVNDTTREKENKLL